MPPSSDWDDAATLATALRIAEKAFRILIVTSCEPYTAVEQAAEELGRSGGRAHERLIEELSEAGTIGSGRTAGREVLAAAVAEFQHRLRRARRR